MSTHIVESFNKTLDKVTISTIGSGQRLSFFTHYKHLELIFDILKLRPFDKISTCKCLPDVKFNTIVIGLDLKRYVQTSVALSAFEQKQTQHDV